MLCACDLLNEGWDCPDVEVLLMARPTLSKVIYLQQFGRGTRKSPGKECLIVFDFVDNATRYNQSFNLHRILGVAQYRPAAGTGAARPDGSGSRTRWPTAAADTDSAGGPLDSGLPGDRRVQLAGSRLGDAVVVGSGGRARRSRGPRPHGRGSGPHRPRPHPAARRADVLLLPS